MPNLNRQSPSRALACILIAGLAFPAAVLADFKGGDTLKTAIASNWNYSPIGGGLFTNLNSRLEFLVETPATGNSAFLEWQVNEGGYNQNWYIQADAYLDLLRFPENGDGIELGLGVLPSEENGPRFFTLALNRYQSDGSAGAGITVIDTENYLQEETTNARAAKLRLHYDRISKTITPSWNTGSGWKYGAPRNLTAWNMKSSETFRAVLFGRSAVTNAQNGEVASGQACFKNFRVGKATPEIVVERSASSELQDNKGTVLFGVATSDVGKVTKTFRIRNQGTAVLTGLDLSVSGAQARDFGLSSVGKHSLVPGASTTFKVTFRPKSPGVRNATVFLRNNDSDETPFEIKVSGRGVE
jgi:hypothetical protein